MRYTTAISPKRLRVGVVYGGRSSEHEVSLASAAAVIAHLDPQRYEPVPIRIGRDGRWSLPDEPPAPRPAAEAIAAARAPAAPGRDVLFPAQPAAARLLAVAPGLDRIMQAARAGGGADARLTPLALDVVFPVVHGPYGEDGTLQGLLELANAPYVGAGVLGSAAGMDKAVAKTLLAARGLPVVPHLVVPAARWDADASAVLDDVAGRLAWPLFVKPANLGSSVGISKVDGRGGLERAIARAREFDRRVLVEEAVPDAREIECGVLGNDAPEVSVAGEIVPAGEFYDYEAKYLDDRSACVVPAALSAEQADSIRTMAREAFLALDCAGMARVDFLLARGTGRIVVSEVNTIPGFTTISMYAKLWQASGLDYPRLLDRLIELALARHADKQRLRTSLG